MSIYLGPNLLSSSSIDSSNIIGTINTSTESIVINQSHLPDISITDVETFASTALRNASTNAWHKGDIAVITSDPVTSYIFVGNDGDNNGTADSDWQILNTPSAIPIATQSVIGGVKIGYTDNARNYALEVDGDMEAFVNVPWVDTTTNESITLSGVVTGTGTNAITTAFNAATVTSLGKADSALQNFNGLDYASDGTGILPVDHGGTGLSAITTLQNSGVNYASDGTGILPVDHGGTGLSAITTLQNSGVNYASDGTGILPIEHGGTGVSTGALLEPQLPSDTAATLVTTTDVSGTQTQGTQLVSTLLNSNTTPADIAGAIPDTPTGTTAQYALTVTDTGGTDGSPSWTAISGGVTAPNVGAGILSDNVEVGNQNATTGLKFWVGTRDEYDALSTYSSETQYTITNDNVSGVDSLPDTNTDETTRATAGVISFWSGTKDAYDALTETRDQNTIYYITDE